MATSKDYGLGEYDFARGWFAVADSKQVERKPLNVHYFGQDMVLFRGASGRVIMLDAYCPHMGTHLGGSRNSATVLDGSYLEGDSIRCPFHAWRFGADGKCNQIPYHDGPIPEKARLKSWHVEERWGIVFCWYDPEELEPDFPLPDIPEWDDPRYVRWSGLDAVADLNHPVEIFDNESDAPHLQYLHGAGKVGAFETEMDGHCYHERVTMIEGLTYDDNASVLSGADGVTVDPSGLKTTTTVGAYYGPGLMVARFLEASGVQLLCITPIDDGTCRVTSAAMLVSHTGNADPTLDEQIRSRFAALVVDGLRRDGEIWRTKKPALKILQITSDAPFGQARRWYSQFYYPRAVAAEKQPSLQGKLYVRGIQPWSESEFAKQQQT